jgi:hypothetical protein
MHTTYQTVESQKKKKKKNPYYGYYLPNGFPGVYFVPKEEKEKEKRKEGGIDAPSRHGE